MLNNPAGDRSFQRLQFAAFTNTVATRCVEVAIAWWVLQRSGSQQLFGLLVAFGVGSDVLSRGVLSWLGDRYDGRRVLLACYTTSALTCAALAAAAAGDRYSVGFIAAGEIVLGICLGVREPLQMALTRRLVAQNDVSRAVRSRSMINSLSAFTGPLLGGILIGPLGVPTVLFLTTGLVLIALLGASGMAPLPVTAVGGRQQPGIRAWARNTADGFLATRRVRPEWFLALLTMVINFAMYPVFAVVLPAVVEQRFATQSWVLASMNVAFSAGLIFGSTYFTRRMQRRYGRKRSVLSGFLVLGLGFAALGIVTRGQPTAAATAAAGVCCLGPAGIGLSLVTVNTATVRMLASPESHRTRIFGTVAFISGLVMPIGALGSGIFAEHLSPSSTLLVLGCVVCACGLAANAVRILTEFLQMSDAELDNAYERRFPEAFAPRPVPART